MALVGAVLLGGCQRGVPRPPRPRLVVLYTTCSLNRGFLEPYGSKRPTPAFARFAADGLVFDRHQTEAGQSSIGFASIFSGAQAWRHGAYYNPTVLGDDLTLIGEAFAADGWETCYWSSHNMCGPRLNYSQGVAPEHVFRRHKADLAGQTANDADFDALLAGLQADPARRAFVQVNFTFTHHPYASYLPAAERPRLIAAIAESLGTSRARVRTLLELYEQNRLELEWDYPATVARLGLDRDAERELARVVEASYANAVAELDTWFGRFLERIDAHGLTAQSLIAVTSDHGEVLDRPNALYHWTHGLQLAPEVTCVPLLLRGPGVRVGRYAGVSRSIDVFPTLAGLAGVSLDGLAHTWEGVDLAAAVRGEEPPPELRAFSHTAIVSEAQHANQPSFALRDRFFPDSDPASMWTAMRDGDRYYRLRKTEGTSWALQVFDLAADPGLERDLYDPSDPAHVDAEHRLSSYRARLIEGYLTRGADAAPQLPVDEQVDRLRELGYVR